MAIILVGMPAGQVLSHFHPHRHDGADRPLLDQLLEPDQARMKPQLVADQADQASPLEFFD